jgi:hypothetical protein
VWEFVDVVWCGVEGCLCITPLCCVRVLGGGVGCMVLFRVCWCVVVFVGWCVCVVCWLMLGCSRVVLVLLWYV